jgi:hypothetical protein
MNAGTKYFSPASISNFGFATSALSYAVESIGIDIVHTPINSGDNENELVFHGFNNPSEKSDINAWIIKLWEGFPWRSGLKVSFRLEIYNKIPTDTDINVVGPVLAAVVVAFNVFNKRSLEQRDLFDYTSNCLKDQLDGKTYNSLACSLIGGMIVGHNGSSIKEYQRISFPQGFSSVLCVGPKKPLDSRLPKEPRSVDSLINLTTQLALILYKSNLDLFLAFSETNFNLENLSLDNFETSFAEKAKIYGINTLFRPAKDNRGLVAVATNSFKASELADEFNSDCKAKGLKGDSALFLKHNHEGVYKY